MVIKSNELYRNMKNIPKWDFNKGSSGQDSETLDFYFNELNKIIYGTTIGGVKFSGYLYWHLNFWHMPVDTDDVFAPRKDSLPDLRDNEWFINEALVDAEKKKCGVALFGSRRIAKSCNLTSHTCRASIIYSNSVCQIVGGDSGDIQNNIDYFEHGYRNLHPFIKYPRSGKDWEKGVTFGTRDKDNEKNIFSTVRITNISTNKKGASESTAGGTYSGWILDEIGKIDFLGAYEAARPAFGGRYGWRFVPILAGTTGNIDLCSDAMKVMNNPERYNMLPMDYDYLERFLPEDFTPTWKRIKFGIFVPGQMSEQLSIKKKETTLGKYLKKKHPDLEKIRIFSTDWAEATRIINENVNSVQDSPMEYAKRKMYAPMCPSHCFLQTEKNPFNTDVIKRHLEKILSEGDTGKKVDLLLQNGKVDYDFSDKPMADYPFNGKPINSPVVIFEEFDKSVQFITHRNVAGYDGYKTDKTTGDSLGAMYVVGRGLGMNALGPIILASYCDRPETMTPHFKTCELLLQAYGAECLMEGIDMAFLTYMRGRNKDGTYLVNGNEMAKRLNLVQRETNNVGLVSGSRTKQYIVNSVIEYANEIITIGHNEDGTPIEITGCERIKDVYLLKEMINYLPGKNTDRIIAFGHALAWANYLDSINMRIKSTPVVNDDELPKEPSIRNRGFYGISPQKKGTTIRRRGFY